MAKQIVVLLTKSEHMFWTPVDCFGNVSLWICIFDLTFDSVGMISTVTGVVIHEMTKLHWGGIVNERSGVYNNK